MLYEFLNLKELSQKVGAKKTVGFIVTQQSQQKVPEFKGLAEEEWKVFWDQQLKSKKVDTGN